MPDAHVAQLFSNQLRPPRSQPTRLGTPTIKAIAADSNELGKSTAISNRFARIPLAIRNHPPRLEGSGSTQARSIKGAEVNNPATHGRTSNVISASGNFARIAFIAGIARTASPTQFGPRSKIFTGRGLYQRILRGIQGAVFRPIAEASARVWVLEFPRATKELDSAARDSRKYAWPTSMSGHFTRSVLESTGAPSPDQDGQEKLLALTSRQSWSDGGWRGQTLGQSGRLQLGREQWFVVEKVNLRRGQAGASLAESSIGSYVL